MEGEMMMIKKRLISYLLCIALILTSMAVPVSQKHAQAFTQTDVNTATTDFINTYWDSNLKYFYRFNDHQIRGNATDGTFSYQPGNGLYTDFWWEAQLWETVMDIYERTGSSVHRQMVDDVYDGFFAQYPNWQENQFNDDIGWWSLASLRAYELTGAVRYKNQAKIMFDFIYDNAYDTTFGGGIWWNRKDFMPQKNVATNATAAIIAVKLYHAFGDSTYLTRAEALYNWVRTNLFSGSSNGKVYDNVHYVNFAGSGSVETATWEFTYNQGLFMYASFKMYQETGDSAYLDNALSAADWYINKMSYDGTCNYEGDADQPAFRMIFNRYLTKFMMEGKQTQYLNFLQNNASQAFNHRRASDGLIGYDWTMTPDSSYLTSIGAATGVSLLNLVAPDNITGPVIGSGIYEAENAHRYGVDNGNTETGFTGRGYTAGWNTNGTSIDFPVNVNNAGSYRLTFRYSAAAGNAIRRLKINGGSFKSNLIFTGTGSWNAWSSVVSVVVRLNSGDNIINLSYDSASGSANYLNLDQMVVEPVYEAEEGALSNLSTEAFGSGYTGMGYVAGWNSNNQKVEVTVSVPTSGYYTLTFRYAAAAGPASRYLEVNGNAAANNISFPGGISWNDYKTVSAVVKLNSGNNTVSLIFDSTKGSGNYLNYDNLCVGMAYEAELGTLHGLTAESNSAGYTGTGYVAGWNRDGQWVDFEVNVPSDGTYALSFRYAAAAGTATRYLYLNGVAAAENLSFPGGVSWNDYKIVTINANLNSGTNTISLIYDGARGSSNYLNLDNLLVARDYEAESAVLHSINVENVQSGYLGSGYAAGWESDGQWIDFTVNVPAAGRYKLKFRYAAGAGYASRYLHVNGAGAAGNLSFPKGSSWSDYKVVIAEVDLNAGNNMISLIYDSGKGSTNYLNLDNLTVE
jgi:predicted alpha-1,6-mannanase (GH76 family)